MAVTFNAPTDRRERLEQQKDLLLKRDTIRLDTATREGRDLSPEEAAAHEKAVTEIAALTAQQERLAGDDDMLEHIAQLGNGSAPRSPSRVLRAGPMLSIGQQFIKSPVYEELRKTRSRGKGWNSAESSELHLYAATLTEDPASGGALVTPMTRAGIVPLPTPPLGIADLFATGLTTSNSLVVMTEKSFTNAAAPVLEAGVKPESSLTFEQKVEPVRKIATWIPASEEILEDALGLRSYIDQRLTLFVRLEEDDQLLNGTGLAPELQGVLVRPGLAPAVARTDPETNADALARQIFAIQNATNLPADGIVLNPINWQSILLQKNDANDYYGDGPFAAPNALSLWGVPVALSSRLAAGTALVGAFTTGAQIFRRGGVRVDASNSHADFFIKNLVAIRAEERLALAVYRPAAFGTVTGLV